MTKKRIVLLISMILSPALPITFIVLMNNYNILFGWIALVTVPLPLVLMGMWQYTKHYHEEKFWHKVWRKLNMPICDAFPHLFKRIPQDDDWTIFANGSNQNGKVD